MDEPASALDPIATGRVEDLILDLKKDFTIVIVTHNMQQAARISDYTAFFYLGELIEYDTTNKILPIRQKTDRGLCDRPLRLIDNRELRFTHHPSRLCPPTSNRNSTNSKRSSL